MFFTTHQINSDESVIADKRFSVISHHIFFHTDDNIIMPDPYTANVMISVPHKENFVEKGAVSVKNSLIML